MPDDAFLLSVRVPPDFIKRADRLVKPVSKNPHVASVGRITRSTVLKLAIARGLESLEKEYA